jgi:hypothetical protein
MKELSPNTRLPDSHSVIDKKHDGYKQVGQAALGKILTRWE